MIEIIRATIDEYQLLPQQGRLVVAVSGGTDSLCLLHVLNRLCGPGKAYPHVQLLVAHLDHQLRGEVSRQEAEEITRLAHEWNLPCVTGSIDVQALAEQEHRSLEDASRSARYQFLRSVAQGQPIAVAHHRDDQVETLLLHWLRGGGLGSMVGLQPRQGDIIRPLLTVGRADTQAYCQTHQLHPFEDASNADTRYVRNRIRHELLPLLEAMNPGFRATLLRNTEVLRMDYAWIQTEVERVWPVVVRTTTSTTIEMSIPALQKLPTSLQRHILRQASALLCSGQSPLEVRHYNLLYAFIETPATQSISTLHLPHNLRAERRRDILIFNSGSKQESYQASQQSLMDHTSAMDALLLSIPGSIAIPGTPWIAHAEWLSEPLRGQVLDTLHHEDWTRLRALLPETPYSVYVDAATLTSEQDSSDRTRPITLSIRTRRDGDRIQPLGMSQEKKVKDVLIDRHIPRDERAHIPLFFSTTTPAHCVWLGGIHLDQRARLTAHTHTIVRLSLTRAEHEITE